MDLKKQLAEYRAGWYQRVPAERQAIMERHIEQLRSGAIARTILKVGDHAPEEMVLPNAKGETVDVGTLLAQGPVIVTFYRGGWCPYCNLELKAYQAVLPEIKAAGASLVAISPENPDETVSTAEKNALSFEVLSDVGQKVGRAFGLVYDFTDELRSAYEGFGRDIPRHNGTPGEWALPVSATYVIDSRGVIIYADTSVDYRDRADPRDVLEMLTQREAAAE
ncbi:MAG: peroxiredoxin-like family protein [Stellaceae bacterium]